MNIRLYIVFIIQNLAIVFLSNELGSFVKESVLKGKRIAST